MRLAQPWIDHAARIGADPADDDETRIRKALLVLISVLILPIALLWGAIYLAFGVWAGLIAWLYLVISVVALAVFSRTRDTEWLLRVELVDILLAPTISMAFVGGFLASGAVGLWGILAPLGALVFNGARSGIRWFVAFVAVFLVSGLVGELSGGESLLPRWFETTMIALNVTVAGAVVFGLLAEFVREREVALAELRVEQDRAENLLLNILPRSIADRLKADTATIADQFAAASILFADVVDFTPFAERLQPAEVVEMLDHLFTHFDLLAERYEVEKIKTIGDSYMAAAGVPAPRTDHARVMALMAIDMREAMRSQDAVGHLGLELRIGINSGPGSRRRDRTEAVPVRPVGRRRQYGEPDGVPRDARADPGDARDLRAAQRRVRARSHAGPSRSRARATWRRGTWSGGEPRSPPNLLQSRQAADAVSVTPPR